MTLGSTQRIKHPLAPGTLVNKYKINGKPNTGHMTISYPATKDAKQFRLKFPLLEDCTSEQRTEIQKHFDREAFVTTSLNRFGSYFIGAIEDFDSGEAHCIVTEPLPKPGQTLHKMIEEAEGKNIKLPWRVIRQLSVQLAEAIQIQHGLGLVNRGLKHTNIYVTNRLDLFSGRISNFANVALIDQTRLFSLSTRLRSKAPEEAFRPTTKTFAMNIPFTSRADLFEADDHRIDIRLLGIIMYEMIAGPVLDETVPLDLDLKSVPPSTVRGERASRIPDYETVDRIVTMAICTLADGYKTIDKLLSDLNATARG